MSEELEQDFKTFQARSYDLRNSWDQLDEPWVYKENWRKLHRYESLNCDWKDLAKKLLEDNKKLKDKIKKLTNNAEYIKGQNNWLRLGEIGDSIHYSIENLKDLKDLVKDLREANDAEAN